MGRTNLWVQAARPRGCGSPERVCPPHIRGRGGHRLNPGMCVCVVFCLWYSVHASQSIIKLLVYVGASAAVVGTLTHTHLEASLPIFSAEFSSLFPTCTAGPRTAVYHVSSSLLFYFSNAPAACTRKKCPRVFQTIKQKTPRTSIYIYRLVCDEQEKR